MQGGKSISACKELRQRRKGFEISLELRERSGVGIGVILIWKVDKPMELGGVEYPWKVLTAIFMVPIG